MIGSEGGDGPITSDDIDINIRNTGQRVRAILVVVGVLVAAGVFFYLYTANQKKIERHEEVQKAFQVAHTNGYVAFWEKSEVDVKEMKTNADFGSRLKDILKVDALRYAKHLDETAIPVLDGALPAYKQIAAPTEYATEMEAMVKAAEGMRNAWKEFADKINGLKPYYDAKEKLQAAGNKWLGAQQNPTEKKFLSDGTNYIKMVQCILTGKKVVFEVKPEELSNTLQDSCLNDEAAWFERAAMECMPLLLRKSEEPDAIFTQTIEVYETKWNGELPDTRSVFGVEICLKNTYSPWEDAIIEKLAQGWADYVKAQNDLLKANKEALKKLR